MAQAHVSVMFSGWEKLINAIVSAQTSIVTIAKLSMTPTCALSVKKDTTLDKMATVMNATGTSATSTSNLNPSHAPAKPASTGTAHAAVATAVTTALTVPQQDPSIVALVSLATSSLRTQTPVLTSVPLASLRLVPLKSAIVETQRRRTSSSPSRHVKLMIFSGSTKATRHAVHTTLTGRSISGVVLNARSVKRTTHIPLTIEDFGSTERWNT